MYVCIIIPVNIITGKLVKIRGVSLPSSITTWVTRDILLQYRSYVNFLGLVFSNNPQLYLCNQYAHLSRLIHCTFSCLKPRIMQVSAQQSSTSSRGYAMATKIFNEKCFSYTATYMYISHISILILEGEMYVFKI